MGSGDAGGTASSLALGSVGLGDLLLAELSEEANRPPGPRALLSACSCRERCKKDYGENHCHLSIRN